MNASEMLTACLLAFVLALPASAQTATAEPATQTETTPPKVIVEIKPEVAAPEAADPKEPVEPIVLTLAEGKLEVTAPGVWKKVAPKSRILEAELQITAAEGDQQNGRLTIMRAGGSLPANVARWEGQFSQPSGDTKATVTDETISGLPVKIVDISGTFADSMGRGPFAGGQKVARADYRMLAAIIQTDELGNYFLKFIGPKKTITANADAFKKMVRELKLK